MKAKKLLILFGTALVSLCGCKTSTAPAKVNLDYGHIQMEEIGNITQLDATDYDGLSSLISHKRNFALAVYNPTCGCWTDFQKPLTDFINKYHYEIKYIDANILRAHEDRFGIYTELGDLPGIVFFKEGKLLRQKVYYQSSESDRKIFKNSQKFEAYMLKNINVPKMYYVDEDVLKSYINEGKEFNLYITKFECPDCSAFDETFLFPWNNKVNKVNSNLYIWDIKDHIGQPDYQSTKDYYGLSEAGNPTFGWSTGVMPTLQHRRGSQVLDMISAINDYIVDDKIVSYFTTEHVNASEALRGQASKFVLNGQTMTKKFDDWDEWRKEQLVLQKDIINTFVNYYVK